MGSSRGGLVLACLATPIFLFLLIPTVIVVPVAFTSASFIDFPPSGFSLDPLRDFFADPSWTSAMWTSLTVAGITVVLSCTVATCAALAMHRSRFRGKSVALALILAPLLAPLIVLALAFFLLFSELQLVGTIAAIALAHTVHAAPYAYLAVEATLAGHDPALDRSARSLGGGVLAVFRHAYMPSLWPGIVTAGVFAFAVSMDEAVIALFLQGPGVQTLPVKIFQEIQFSQSPTIAAASSLLVVVAAVIFVAHLTTVVHRRRRERQAREQRLGADLEAQAV